MTNKEQHTMLMIKSLLNHMRYFVKEEHLKYLDDYHKLCRKYCSWGKPSKKARILKNASH